MPHSPHTANRRFFLKSAGITLAVPLLETPGSKKGTDPQSLINQPYIYTEPTGGFLRISVSPVEAGKSILVLEHHDDRGKIMNSVTKSTSP